MRSSAKIGSALLATGFIAGSLSLTPEAKPIQRGPYRVMRGDFHVHTRLSDGFLHPFDVVLAAERQDLDVIAVTEHNMIWAAQLARWFSQLVDGPLVLVGEEITTKTHHLIGLGLDKAIPWHFPLESAIRAVHSQGGVVIAAHPVKRYWESYEPVLAQLDGAELMHPIAFQGTNSRGWSWTHMRDFFESATKRGYELAPIGSSDFHLLKAMGVCRTYVFAEDATAESVLEAIRDARTVVFTRDGTPYGKQELVKLLENEPIPERAVESYEPDGAIDGIGRVLGWCGLVILVLFRRTIDSRDRRSAEKKAPPASDRHS